MGHEQQTPPPAQNKRAHALSAKFGLGPRIDPLPPGHRPVPQRCQDHEAEHPTPLRLCRPIRGVNQTSILRDPTMTPIEITGSSAVTTRHDREPLLFFFRRPRGVRNRHNAVRALAFRQASRVSERLFYPNPQSPTGPQPRSDDVGMAGAQPRRHDARPARAETGPARRRRAHDRAHGSIEGPARRDDGRGGRKSRGIRNHLPSL
jgi:hypothetical protein